MKNTIELKYNERAWAIDVISHINLYCYQNNSVVTKAGGENTLKGHKSSLFPDVLLYGNELSGTVLQGWELKMPDTPITDQEFINNAALKANKMGLNSFLLWNAREATLYIKQDNNFVINKNWVITNIKSRDDVQQNEKVWKSLLIEI